MEEQEPLESVSERYRMLIETIGDELGRTRGWKAKAADRLGVSASVVSRSLRDPERRVSGRTLDRAAAALGIRRTYFTAPGAADLDAHRDVTPDNGELLGWLDDFIGRAASEMQEPRLRTAYLEDWAAKRAELAQSAREPGRGDAQ